MLFDLKAIALYGLLAVALANPVSIPGSSELEIRAKKKKVTAFKCKDVTLTKDAVGTAFSKGKGLADEALGPQRGQRYPHRFGNRVGNNQQVFQGVQKELREFPIIEGGEYQGKFFIYQRIHPIYERQTDQVSAMQVTAPVSTVLFMAMKIRRLWVSWWRRLAAPSPVASLLRSRVRKRSGDPTLVLLDGLYMYIVHSLVRALCGRADGS